MSSRVCHRRSAAAIMAALLLPAVAMAQQGRQEPGKGHEPLRISTFIQKPLQLYQAPDLQAARTAIEVPQDKPGADWLVLETGTQFYRVRAGSHGEGWVKRGALTVVRSGGLVQPCVDVVSLPQEPIATTAGAGRRGC